MSRAPMPLLDIATGNLTAALMVTLAESEIPADDPRITCAANPLLPAHQVRELYAELLDVVERHHRHDATEGDDWPIESVEDEVRRITYMLANALLPCPGCVVRMEYVGDVRPAGRCPVHPPRHLKAVA